MTRCGMLGVCIAGLPCREDGGASGPPILLERQDCLPREGVIAVTLVPSHSHWGAFLAEVEDGRVVGVRPFARDPDPSPLIRSIPAAVHSETRIARPMVR